MRTATLRWLHWSVATAAAFLFAIPAIAQAPTAPPKSPAPAAAATKSTTGTEPAAPPRQLTIANKVWTGDFDQMLERRDDPRLRAVQPLALLQRQGARARSCRELVRDFERYLNIKYAKQLGKRPLTVYIGPATRDKLLPDVAEGMADIAIGNLTITDERLKLVDFVARRRGPADHQRSRRHRPRHRPRSPRSTISSGKTGARAQGVELLREPGVAQRALQEGRQAGNELRLRPRRRSRTRT